MPLLDRVLSTVGLARKKDIITTRTPSIRVMGGYTVGGAQYSGGNYAVNSREGYQKNSDVYACISLITQAGKQVKWWDGTGEGKSNPDLLAKSVGVDLGYRREIGAKLALNPIPSYNLFVKAGGPVLVEAWLSYMLVSGNAFLEVERDLKEKPAMLFLDRPDRVVANPPGGPGLPENARPGDVVAWQLTTGINRAIIPARNMVQSKLWNPLDDIFGMAPLDAAMLRVQAQNEGGELMTRLLGRGYAPGWIEAAEGSEWADTQVADLRQKIRESKQVGNELFLQNAKWHTMGLTPTDSAVTDLQELTKRDIAAVFHVDPSLIGDVSTRTYATYQESRRALYMEAVIPLLSQFRDDWNKTIGKELQSPLDFDRDSFDAISYARTEAADRVVKLFSAGLITQDEAREDLEYDAAAPGSVFYAPANLVPLDAAGLPDEGAQ